MKREQEARYGMRRADGQPWDTTEYQVGYELTEDAMVFVCWDEYDWVSCVIAQNHTMDSPHAGEAIPVSLYSVSGEYEDDPDRFKVWWSTFALGQPWITEMWDKREEK